MASKSNSEERRPGSPRLDQAPAQLGCVPIAPSGAAVRPPKTSETVARAIVADIVEQGLNTGDSLLSEAAMLEQYSVSRESLREALRLLEVQGLITIRRGPGGGPVVGTVDPASLGRISTLYYHLSGATYRELFDAWILSEAQLAELAASNPDADARAEALRAYLSPEHSSNSHDEVEEFMTPHIEFHAAIARLGSNRVLELLLATSGQIVSHHMAVDDDPRELAEIIDREHRALALAIIDGEAPTARRLMEEHIRSMVAFIKVHLGERINDFIEWH